MNSFLLLIRTQDCSECTSCRRASKHGTQGAGRVGFSSARGTSKSRDVIYLSATSSSIKLQPSGSFRPQQEECISCSVAIKHFSLLKAGRSEGAADPSGSAVSAPVPPASAHRSTHSPAFCYLY